jgi:hypothetical protein
LTTSLSCENASSSAQTEDAYSTVQPGVHELIDRVAAGPSIIPARGSLCPLPRTGPGSVPAGEHTRTFRTYILPVVCIHLPGAELHPALQAVPRSLGSRKKLQLAKGWSSIRSHLSSSDIYRSTALNGAFNDSKDDECLAFDLWARICRPVFGLFEMCLGAGTEQALVQGWQIFYKEHLGGIPFPDALAVAHTQWMEVCDLSGLLNTYPQLVDWNVVTDVHSNLLHHLAPSQSHASYAGAVTLTNYSEGGMLRAIALCNLPPGSILGIVPGVLGYKKEVES